MRYASVLDESTVKLALATDETAEESTVYEFQRWDDVDSLWIPLPIESNEEDSENVTHVDVNLNTNRQTYTYRAVVFNACGDIINRSEEATTMLLQGFSHPEPQTFENNLLWTAYDGFEQGLITTRSFAPLHSMPKTQEVSLPMRTHCRKAIRMTSSSSSSPMDSSVIRCLPLETRWTTPSTLPNQTGSV